MSDLSGYSAICYIPNANQAMLEGGNSGYFGGFEMPVGSSSGTVMGFSLLLYQFLLFSSRQFRIIVLQRRLQSRCRVIPETIQTSPREMIGSGKEKEALQVEKATIQILILVIPCILI